jgi:hypothetical protein
MDSSFGNHSPKIFISATGFDDLLDTSGAETPRLHRMPAGEAGNQDIPTPSGWWSKGYIGALIQSVMEL